MHHGHRSLLAAPHAGRGDHAHLAPEQGGEAFQQVLGAGHFATQSIAYAHRQRRRGRQASTGTFLHHVEVVVESRHLVDFGLCQSEQLRERSQVGRAQLAVAVIDSMQVFDEQVVPKRRAEHGLHLGERLRIDSAAFRPLPLALLGGARGRNGDDRFIQHMHSDTWLSQYGALLIYLSN